MYKTHFGLSRQPFSIAPNPRFLYMSRQHREALALLTYGVRASDGFVQLTGEVGTGKTTICRCLVEQLPDAVDVALILNPRVTALELVASLCDELHITHPKDTTSIKVLTDALNAYLLENHAAGRRTVLIIDEAQCLSTDALEQVRLLTNLETSNAKLLQIILVGQPELRDLLARDDLRQLAQRITARFHLMPISRAETAAYIKHRLQLAGASRAVFDERVINLVHQLAKGIPRLINVLCDRAMLGAYAEGASVVDTRIMRKAAAEVLPEAQREGTLQRPWRQGLALTLLLGVGLAAGLWYSTSPLRAPTAASAVNDTVAAPAPSSSPTATPGQARPEPGPTPRAQAVTEQPPVRAPSAPEPVTVEAGASVTASTAEFPQPGAAKQMPSAEPSLAERLDEAGAGAGASAWPGLYRLWGYASAAATDEQACAQAPAAGLSCLSGSGNWGLLRRLDRPAVLLLHTESGRLLPVLLQQADADRARLEIDGEVMWVSQAELEQRWYGPYRLLWKKPPSANALLQPGMRGSDVRWLREQLARLNGQDDAAGDPALYDASLAAAVRMLQREHGLIADGIAGAHTLITLNNLLADPDIPHLAGSATGSPE